MEVLTVAERLVERGKKEKGRQSGRGCGDVGMLSRVFWFDDFCLVPAVLQNFAWEPVRFTDGCGLLHGSLAGMGFSRIQGQEGVNDET